ncbi:MAG: hypothetical protein KAQ69_11130 [Spirochaetales bacterium]|nr:hypothetical protein [Spirochaetales bacterium]
MGKLDKDLLLFQALELRNNYDRKISLLKSIFETTGSKRDIFSVRSDIDRKDFDDAFDFKQVEKDLKILETKRVKLNQAVQIENFSKTFQFKRSDISIAEALEIKKGLLSDIEALSGKVKKSAFKEIVHKEERDIVHRPKFAFNDTYKDYCVKLKELRTLNDAIHLINHSATVKFKDEN